MSILTICNHKGGTGKTTTVMHLAAAFGLGGRRVLVVDLDPQCFLTQMMGVTEPPPERSSLALFSQEVSMTSLPVVSVSGFDVLPASQTMTKALRKLTGPMDAFWIREALAQGTDYDLVIFDTAAAISAYTMNALVASDHVLIPVTPEYQPVVGAGQTWQTCKLVREKLNPALTVPLFLLTQVDARKRDHASYSQYVESTYEGQVLDSVIRTSASLAETRRDGQTVFDSDVLSRGALDYANAADEISKRMMLEPQAVETPQSPTNGTEQSHADSNSMNGGGRALHSWIPLDKF